MNKFFVPKEIYKERLAICKSCDHYFKLTGNCKKCGCFMKVKARIAPLSCPINKWGKVREHDKTKEIPQELIDEVLLIFPDVKTGRAKDQETKKKLIDLYNTIYGANYSTGTSCSSCLSSVLSGIRTIYYEHNKNN